MSSLEAKVRLKNGSKVTILLVTSAKIDDITRKIMEDTGLAMQYDSKLELVSHTSHSRLFFSLCKDIKVAIRGLKMRHPIFVIEHRDYNFVLGQLFSNFVKFSQEHKLDRIFGTITYF